VNDASTDAPASAAARQESPAAADTGATGGDDTTDTVTAGTGLVIAGAVLLVIAGLFIGMDMAAEPAAAPPGRQITTFQY